MNVGPVTFLVPWLLAGLVVLPVLWWLLRAIPPAPARRAFPGVALLRGLREREVTPARTPWWLLVLRLLAAAAAILAFAQPVLNPRAAGEDVPLVVLFDGGWADAPDWAARRERAAAALSGAAADGRAAAVLSLAGPVPAEAELPLRPAAEWGQRLAGLAPAAWRPDRAGWAGWFAGLDEDFETLWLSDGLAGEGARELAEALVARGTVRLVRPETPARGLTPPRLEDGALRAEVLGGGGGAVQAVGTDPNGIERVLARTQADESGAAVLEMPTDLRNRVSRLVLESGRSAGGVALADGAVRRRKVGLMAGRAGGEAQDLNDPLTYLRKAMVPFADLIEAPLAQMLQAAPDVLVMADVARLGPQMQARVTEWVESGGVLIRFAGPRLAQSGAGQLSDDPLLPVRLRAGGRMLGGAMSWAAPRQLQPFGAEGPFAGLNAPGDVDIRAQVMAQPAPDLGERVLAALEDGTPLVTGAGRGDGRVVLFHVTAAADWSNLPLTGLFVRMLERLVQGAGGTMAEESGPGEASWLAVETLDGFGELHPEGTLAAVPGARLAGARPGPDMPPGYYESGERRIAVNVLRAGDVLAPLEPMPAAVIEAEMAVAAERDFKPWLLALALGLMAVDVLATLGVSGRLARAAAVLVAVGAAGAAPGARAQDEAALHAATQTVLAYVKTGDARVDAVSRAGLDGLGQVLGARTSIETGAPVAVDLEADDLSLLPFLYWPVSADQALPSAEANARLNQYLRFGGMILFDTRDADLGAAFGGTSPNGAQLQRIAAGLDIPPLAPIPDDHVLTRTFYLLQDFPGRWENTEVWAEAAPPVEAEEGMPFRDLNDGVTPVVIGGNDWAAAWAVDEGGQPMYRVGRGISGERQREMALRFGVNLIMHVMTGNYKSDQVHVPALLERLGQ